MTNEINNNLMILEAEKERAELRLKEQIKSIRKRFWTIWSTS